MPRKRSFATVRPAPRSGVAASGVAGIVPACGRPSLRRPRAGAASGTVACRCHVHHPCSPLSRLRLGCAQRAEAAGPRRRPGGGGGGRRNEEDDQALAAARLAARLQEGLAERRSVRGAHRLRYPRARGHGLRADRGGAAGVRVLRRARRAGRLRHPGQLAAARRGGLLCGGHHVGGDHHGAGGPRQSRVHRPDGSARHPGRPHLRSGRPAPPGADRAVLLRIGPSGLRVRPRPADHRRAGAQDPRHRGPRGHRRDGGARHAPPPEGHRPADAGRGPGVHRRHGAAGAVAAPPAGRSGGAGGVHRRLGRPRSGGGGDRGRRAAAGRPRRPESCPAWA